MDEEKKTIANRENCLYKGGTWEQWGVFNMIGLVRDRKSMCATICMYGHAFNAQLCTFIVECNLNYLKHLFYFYLKLCTLT